jgi:DNA adenine methylase
MMENGTENAQAGGLCMATWMGGKAKLAGKIIALLPKHRCYVEPFGGMASVLLNKVPAKTEVYNDLDGRLVSLFRCVKYHGSELASEFDHLLKSRETFQEFKKQPGFTEIQRAARFLYCQSLGFGGAGEHFGTGARSGGASTRRINTIREMIGRLCVRLAPVLIENEDWEQCLSRYDTPETFFFCDPPYYGTEEYAVPFSDRDRATLAERLRALKGKFLLTDLDTRHTRSRYRGFRCSSLSSQMGRSKERSVAMRNLVVRNY